MIFTTKLLLGTAHKLMGNGEEALKLYLEINENIDTVVH